MAAAPGQQSLRPGCLLLPGGKPETGEGWWSCLKRELWEELAVEMAGVRDILAAPFGNPV